MAALYLSGHSRYFGIKGWRSGESGIWIAENGDLRGEDVKSGHEVDGLGSGQHNVPDDGPAVERFSYRSCFFEGKADGTQPLESIRFQ